MHLRDLVNVGKVVDVEVQNIDGTESVVQVYVRKPGSVQQDDAMNKARAAQARKRLAFKKKDSEDYLNLIDTVSELTVDELSEMIVRLSANFGEQAHNDVLFSKEHGSDWGEEGVEFTSLRDALEDRLVEILDINDGLGDEDKIVANLDDEVIRIRARLDKFAIEVQDRKAQLERREVIKLKKKKEEELREKLVDEMVATEANITWYQEYLLWMHYYACRDVTNPTLSYFDNITEMRDLPQYVYRQLSSAYDNMTLDGGELKN